MIVDGVKITWISRDEVFDQQDRRGFVPVCRYGLGLNIEPNELGAICRKRRGSPVWMHGHDLFAFGVTVLERIFIVEPAKQYGVVQVYTRPEDADRVEEYVARAIPENADVVLLEHLPPQPKHPDPFCHVGTVAAKWYI